MKYRSQKQWRDANPKKVWAHVCLQSAIRRGLVTPLACAECGADKAEGHHDDYDKRWPFDGFAWPARRRTTSICGGRMHE